jgi:hypothetical protein
MKKHSKPNNNLSCHNNKKSSSNKTQHNNFSLKFHFFNIPRNQNLKKVQNLLDGSPITQSVKEKKKGKKKEKKKRNVG